MSKTLVFFKRLEVQVVSALILAIIFWITFPQFVEYISWMWDAFMKLLKSMLWPLLFLSVTVAVLWLWDFKKLWNIWARTFLYYMATTTIAITVSLVLMNIFKPWKWVEFCFEVLFNELFLKI
jgi:aerobic C4-dicarboxylate transport protein